MVSEGHLRISDLDRDTVAEVLHTAYAEGRLTREEHQERTEAVLVAKTFDDLAPLTADLVPALPTSGGSSVATPGRAGTDPDTVTAMLSSAKRVGPWRVGRSTAAYGFLGSVLLDLTEATFDGPLIEVNAVNVLGELTIRVPDGMTVRDEVNNVLGDSSIKNLGPPDPALPTLVVRGTNVLGDIKVRGPKKPRHWRRALH